MGGPKGGDPKFRAYFPFPDSKFRPLFAPSGGLLVELWSSFKAMDLSKCAFGPLLGSFCETPAATHTDTHTPVLQSLVRILVISVLIAKFHGFHVSVQFFVTCNGDGTLSSPHAHETLIL